MSEYAKEGKLTVQEVALVHPPTRLPVLVELCLASHFTIGSELPIVPVHCPPIASRRSSPTVPEQRAF